MSAPFSREWLDDLRQRAVELRNRVRSVEASHPSDVTADASEAAEDMVAAVAELIAEVAG